MYSFAAAEDSKMGGVVIKIFAISLPAY